MSVIPSSSFLSKLSHLWHPLRHNLFLQRTIILLSCLISFTICAILPIRNHQGERTPAFVLAITVLMCQLWISQTIPLGISSLVPIVLFPLFSIMSGKVVSQLYVNSISMIFLGGFIVALAMERWHLHKRIALFVICKTLGGGSGRGGKFWRSKKRRKLESGVDADGEESSSAAGNVANSTPFTINQDHQNDAINSPDPSVTPKIYPRIPLLLFGFTFTAWIMSQWISNTATSLIMVPNALAVVTRLENLFGKKAVKGLSVSLFMSIAAACNIGGIATIIGTPSNLIFINAYEKLVPGSKEVSFLQWFILGFPLAVINVVISYVFLMLTHTQVSMRRIRAIVKAKRNLGGASANTLAVNQMQVDDIMTVGKSDSAKMQPTNVGNINSTPHQQVINRTPSNEDTSLITTREQTDEEFFYGSTTAPSAAGLDGSQTNLKTIANTDSSSEDEYSEQQNDDLSQNAGPSDSLQSFHRDYKALGRISFEESIVLLAFIVMGVLWASRSGIYFIPGWESFFPKGYMNDGTVAIMVAISLFCIPALHAPPGCPILDKKGKKIRYSIMDWNAMVNLPWDIILLFGGGFALAEAFSESKLDEIIGNQLYLFAEWPPIVLMFMVCMIVVLVTTVVSNVATTTIFLPIVAAVSESAKLHPLMLMLPATFSSKRLTVPTFACTGVFLSVLGVATTVVYCYFMIPIIFDVST